MISRNPALEFMQQLCGTYETADASKLEIEAGWRYGLALDFYSVIGKTKMVGVIGAIGDGEIECFTQIGLPKVIRLIGRKTSDSSICFLAEEPPFTLTFSLEKPVLSVTVGLPGEKQLVHLFKRRDPMYSEIK